MTSDELIKEINSLFSIVNKYLSDNGIETDNTVQQEVVSILKKQSYLPPAKEKEPYCDEFSYYCPKCKYSFGEDSFEYCPDCGQKISWKGI